LGLSEEEVNEIQELANTQYNSLVIEFNLLMSNVKDVNVLIVDNQKILNETRKAKLAVQQLVDVDSSGSTKFILDKLNLKEEQLIIQRQMLADQNNELAAEAKAIYDKIINIKEVVK